MIRKEIQKISALNCPICQKVHEANYVDKIDKLHLDTVGDDDKFNKMVAKIKVGATLCILVKDHSGRMKWQCPKVEKIDAQKEHYSAPHFEQWVRGGA